MLALGDFDLQYIARHWALYCLTCGNSLGRGGRSRSGGGYCCLNGSSGSRGGCCGSIGFILVDEHSLALFYLDLICAVI